MKKWIPVVCIASVIVFFIWGFIEGSFQHSWIVFFAVPLSMAIFKALDKNGDGEDKTE